MSASLPPSDARPAPPPPEQRLELLRALAAAEPDPARKAVLLHGIGRIVDVLQRSDVAATQEYLAAFQSNRGHRQALTDLLGIYERRKSTSNLLKLYQVEAKSARDPDAKASALLDLAFVRADLGQDAAGASAALLEAASLAPDLPDVARVREVLAREANDPVALAAALRSRLLTADDPAYATELRIELATLEAATDVDGALQTLASGATDGAAGIRIALATERTARRAGRRAERAAALARIGEFAARAAETPTPVFDEAGLGPLLWDDPASARAVSVAYLRAAAALEARKDASPERAAELLDRALALDPASPFLRLERLSLATRLGREAWAAEDEEALAEVLADSTLGAFIYNRLAARLDRVGRPDDAAEARAFARNLAPTSAVLAASVEANLRNQGSAAAWLAGLGADAPDARLGTLLEAAFVSSELLADQSRALGYYERALALDANAGVLLGLYGTALLAGRYDAALSALARMEGLDPEANRARLVHRAFLASVVLEDPAPSVHAATALLGAGADADDAQLVRAIGALADDFGLVERAHLRLAELASTKATASAHAIAAARAARARGDEAAAVTHLEAAVAHTPDDPTPVELLRSAYARAGRPADAAAVERRARRARTGESDAVLDALERLAEGVADRDPSVVAAAREALAGHPASPTVRDAVRTVATAFEAPTLHAAVDAAVAAHGDALDRALATLRLAADAVARRDAAAGPLLTSLIDHPTLGLDAALLACVAPAGLVAESVVAAASARIAREGDASGTTDASALPDDPLAGARGAPDADAEVATMLARLGGAVAVAAQIRETLRSASPDTRAQELGIVVLRGANVVGAGAVVAAATEVALAPGADANVRIAALEAAVRDADDAGRDAVRGELGRALLEAGRAADALTHLDAAVSARPDDVASLEALRLAARDAGRPDRFVAACDGLAARATGNRKAELLEDASAVLADSLKDVDGALVRARAALDAAPHRDRAYQRIHALLTARGDAAGLAQLAARRASASADDVARVKRLFEAARHLRGSGDRDGTLAAIAELLTVDPRHAGALAMRVEILVAREAFSEAVDALRALATADVPTSQVKVARLGAADFLERKLGRPDLALLELEQLDAAGLADPAVFQRMARIAEAEDAFGKAIAWHERALERGAVGPRAAESQRALGRLYLRVRRDPARASAAYRSALELAPDDVESATALLPLVPSDDERLAVARSVDAAVRARLTPETLDAAVLRKLLRVSELRGTRDLMKLILSTLTVLRIATEEERAREEENTAFVRRVRPPHGSIDDALMRLRAPGDGGPFAEMAEHLHEVLVDLDQNELSKVGASRSETLAKGDAVRVELLDLGLAFGIADVEVHPSAQLDMRKVVGVPTERGLGLVVNQKLSSPIDPVVRFHAGRIVWSIARRNFALTQRPVDEATAVLLGAMDACEVPLGDHRGRPGVADWSKSIGRVIGRKTRKAVHDLGVAMGDERIRGAEAYCRAARQSSLRAGLLVSSDLDAALSVVLGTSPSLERAVAVPEAADLVCFHLSSTSLALRRDLGLAS